MAVSSQIDSLARNALLGVAAGRISIGVGALLATRPALRVLGFPEPDAGTRALGRLAGSRDIALGTLALLSRADRRGLRAVALAGVGVDGVDAMVLGMAAMRGEEIGAGVALGTISAAAATAAGLWAAARL
jgi:Domain of unknown function (DUF4267)